MKKTLAIFDFDKTITTKDSFDDFLIYRFGYVKFLLSKILNIHHLLLYALGLETNRTIKEKIVSFFYKNKSYDLFLKDCKDYGKNRLPMIISHNCIEILNKHLEDKHEVIILTASFKEWIQDYCDNIGVSKIISSKLEVKDRKITGRLVSGMCCFGKNKKNMLLKEYPNLSEYVTYGYGDSKSDRYFLNIVNEPVLWTKNKNIPPIGYAIVTDGLWRKSVSVIRSLGKKNVHVITMGDTNLTTGMWSKYSKSKFIAKTATNNREEFGTKMQELLEKYKSVTPVIVPMEESTLEWFVENIEKVKDKCNLLIPSKESLKIAGNKAETMRKAESVGINVPKTYYPKNAKELNELVSTLPFDDFIVKPCKGSSSIGLRYCKKSEAFDFTDHWQKYGTLIIQERIPSSGAGMGVSIIMDRESNVIASFAHKRLEQYPNSGGPSTSRISIYDKDLIEASQKLLKSINWIGVAMVEWKFNPNSNKPVLMEINPRFWGSLELAVRSGVDFPYLYYQLARGKKVKIQKEYKENVVCRWVFPGEILRYITKKNKENIIKFLKGIIKESEEWDKQDKRGFFAAIFCQLALALNPRYWKYVKRK